jgi:hypothetical protein
MSRFRSPNKRPNFSQAEKEMIVKVFRGISKDFAELTKTAQMEKKLQIILVVDLEPFNDTWRKKRNVPN